MSAKSKIKLGTILKRSSCIRSISESVLSEETQRLYDSLTKRIEEGKVDANTNDLLRSYIDSLCNTESASRYYDQPLRLVEKFNDINPAISDRIIYEYTTRVLPYVKEVSYLIDEAKDFNITEPQYDSIKEAGEILIAADRILNNHERISSRFNIENEANRIRTLGLKYVVDSCADMVDTYNIKPYQKMNITLEELVYVLDKKGYDYNKDPYGNNYKGTHILPRWREDQIKKREDEQIEKYKEIWSKDIEQRKLKKIEEKKKKQEMDILEEERIKKEIEEINKREEQEKRRQKEKENNVSKENEQLIKNKIKNKEVNKNMNININKNIDNGITYQNGYNDNDYIKNEKTNLDKSESFNFIESLDKLKNKYKNVDLNNIHFYRKKGKDLENKKLLERKLYYAKIKNNILNNRRSVNEFEFSPNPKLLDDSKNPQIARLKNEVNKGYMQISSYIKNLRNNVIEADNNKNKAEKELKFLTNEFDKERKYQLTLDKIEYEKNKNNELYYNNYNKNYYNYTNIKDIDPIYYDLMPITQSNMNKNNETNEMSNLAKVGQNLIKLNSESEFIPIGSNYYNNVYNNIGINEEILLENKTEKDEIKNETVFQPSDD